MFILSQELLAVAVGKGDYEGSAFINKATASQVRDGDFVENTLEGMASMANKLSKAGTAVASLEFSLPGKGRMPMAKVITGLKAGKILAYQYHGDGYDNPDRRIKLGFIVDIAAKNAQYAENAKKQAARKGGKKKPASKGKAKPVKKGFIS